MLASGYGNAGAMDWLGRGSGLPTATSFSKSYWMWADPDMPIDIVIGVGHDPDFLNQVWEEVTVVKSVDLENVNPWSTPFLITICRKPKMPMSELWPQVRPW
jgi:hypothetical protein